MACLCPHLCRLRGREVATVSESLCLTQWLDRSSSRLKTRGKPRANNIMARPMGPGPVLLFFPPAMLFPPGPLGLGMGPIPPIAGRVWREGHLPRIDNNLSSPFAGLGKGQSVAVSVSSTGPPPRHIHRGSNADMMWGVPGLRLSCGRGQPSLSPYRERVGCTLSRSHGVY